MELGDLDAKAALAVAEGEVPTRRQQGVDRLLLLQHWADLHSEDPQARPGAVSISRGGDRLIQLGGEGTPGVQDFCLGEIATARGTGVTATSNALADVLDLMHRLPLTWTVCRAAAAEIWVARRVAKLSRHLPLDYVGVVDSAIARIIAREAGGRVIEVAEAKIIEAAPGLHEQRVEEERRRRYVAFSRTDEVGLRTVIAPRASRRSGLDQSHRGAGRRDHRT